MEIVYFLCACAVIVSIFCLYEVYKSKKREKEYMETLAEGQEEFMNTLTNREDIYHDTLKTVYGDYVEKMLESASSYSERIDKIDSLIVTIANAITSMDDRIKVLENEIDKKKKKLAYKVEDELEKIDSMEGQEFEKWCAKLLKNNGYHSVKLTSASGDQGIDVLAEKDGVSYGIQCKCYSSALGNAPIQEAYAGKAIYNCNVAVVMTNSYFTSGGIEAAQKTNTVLWDRDMLKQMIIVAQENK